MSVIPFRWVRETNQAPRKNSVPLSSLQREVNRLMDSFFTESPLFEMESVQSSPTTSAWLGFTPHVDVIENEKSFEVDVELPGVSESDVELALDQNVLTIKGEKRSTRKEMIADSTAASGKTENAPGFRRTERTYGEFYRAIPFSVDLDESKVEASFKNGILTVKLPKAPSAIREPKKISIKSS